MKKSLFLSVAATAAVMGLILYFSGQTSTESQGLSRTLAEALLVLVPASRRGELVTQLNWLLRKLAHFTLYMALGLGLSGITQRQKRFPAGWAAVCAGLLFAVSDEVHQCFSQGRTSTVRDVVIDVCGVAAGVLLAAYWRKRRGKAVVKTDKKR